MNGLAGRKNVALQQHLRREGVAAFAGARTFLVAAEMLHVRRAVVSASANTEAMLERAGLADLVDELVDGRIIEAEHLRPRPAPDSLLAACRRLGVTPHQAASFETTSAGIAAARAADVSLAVAVGPASVFAAEADLVVSDLAQLSTAAPGKARLCGSSPWGLSSSCSPVAAAPGSGRVRRAGERGVRGGERARTRSSKW